MGQEAGLTSQGLLKLGGGGRPACVRTRESTVHGPQGAPGQCLSWSCLTITC